MARARLTRLDTGTPLAAVGAAVLLAGMFFPWYRIQVTGGSVPGAEALARAGSLDAWQAFAWIDTVLFGAVVVALASAVLAESAPAPIGPRLVAVAGVVATGLIVWRLADPPVAAGEIFTFDVNVSLRAGAFLGLAGAVLVAGGGALSARSRT